MDYIIFAFLALISSASNTIFNRISSSKVSSIVSSVIKSFFIVIVAFFVCAIYGHLNNIYALTGEQWLWIGILGIVTCIDWVFYFLGIKNSHLEAFSPFEASSILFFSNLLFSFFMFTTVTKGGTLLNTIFFYLGQAALLGAMFYAVFNKKINTKKKCVWVLYSLISATAMGFTLVIVKVKLSDIPSDVITLHQMFIVFVVSSITMLVTKKYKELKTIKLEDYGKFYIGAIFNGLLMVFRYQAINCTNAIPQIVNVIIALDFVLVSLATVIFFKENNRKQVVNLIVIVVIGMVFNVLSGLL